MKVLPRLGLSVAAAVVPAGLYFQHAEAQIDTTGVSQQVAAEDALNKQTEHAAVTAAKVGGLATAASFAIMTGAEGWVRRRRYDQIAATAFASVQTPADLL